MLGGAELMLAEQSAAAPVGAHGAAGDPDGDDHGDREKGEQHGDGEPAARTDAPSTMSRYSSSLIQSIRRSVSEASG